MVIEPTTMLAKDQNEATMRVARAIPDKYMDKVDQLDIAIRPF